jgi:mRNA interferase MazF
MPEPERGVVYLIDLDPVEGSEQGGIRPWLVLSIQAMNRSAAKMTIGVPLTTTQRGNTMHMRFDPPEGGLKRVSYAMPEMVRSVSTERLRRKLGRTADGKVDAVAKRSGLLIGLGRTR